MAFLYLIIAFTLNSVANIILKLSSQKGIRLVSHSPITLVAENWLFLSGLFLFALNVIFYYLALSKLPLSLAYPIMVVMSFLIVNTFAMFYFKEQITSLQTVGYCLILIGITLVLTMAKA